jgi:hypothetical protein
MTTIVLHVMPNCLVDTYGLFHGTYWLLLLAYMPRYSPGTHTPPTLFTLRNMAHFRTSPPLHASI